MRTYLLTPASHAVLHSRRYARLEPALLPMALATLGAVLRDRGHPVHLRDQAGSTLPNHAVLQEMVRIHPDLVGISALTGAWRNTVELIRGIRDRLPGTPLVLGNTHATTFADGILSRGLADFVVRGEGEETLPELVQALATGGDPAAIPGLSWRDGAHVRHNPDRPPVADLDALPWPAWDLLDLTAWRYQRIPLVNLRTLPVPLAASRGCDRACTFCSQDKTSRPLPPRRRKVERVVAELDHHVRRHGFRAFGFNDAYFPWNDEVGREFAGRLSRLSWRAPWVTETRVDEVTDPLMGVLARSGLHAVFYGFESGDPTVLGRLGKGTTVEQGREAVRIAHRHGVLVVGFFMVGLPGEDRDAMERTLRFAVETGVDIAKFAVTMPYPGSRLFRESGRTWLEPEECDAFTSWGDWTCLGLPATEATRFQRQAMLRFYARPRYALQALRLFTPSDLATGGWLLLSRALAS